MRSATQSFMKKPHNIQRNPLSKFSYENLCFSLNWGNMFLARSMGPATNCGKNEMKSA